MVTLKNIKTILKKVLDNRKIKLQEITDISKISKVKLFPIFK